MKLEKSLNNWLRSNQGDRVERVRKSLLRCNIVDPANRCIRKTCEQLLIGRQLLIPPIRFDFALPREIVTDHCGNYASEGGDYGYDEGRFHWT